MGQGSPDRAPSRLESPCCSTARRPGPWSCRRSACLLGGLLVPLTADAAGKTTICHRTSSAKNPYRRITVSQSALAKQSGHKGHTGAVWSPTATPKWGDVVPDATEGGSAQVAQTWTVAGQAVRLGTTTAGQDEYLGQLRGGV